MTSQKAEQLEAQYNNFVELIKNNYPLEKMPLVMVPDITTKPTGQGTGLGLSLAYDIVVKGHGGALEVESKENEGAVFMLKLPI